MLSVGGYFGYNWYQDKLLKERIAKLEKVQDAFEDLEEAYTFSGNFDPNQLEKYKSQLKEIENLNKNLEDLEIDKEVESEVKKCTEVSKGVVTEINRLLEIVERVKNRGNSTAEEVREIQTIENNIDKYISSKSCEIAETEIIDLIKDLKKK